MSKEFNTVFRDSTGFAVLVSSQNISKPERQKEVGDRTVSVESWITWV